MWIKIIFLHQLKPLLAIGARSWSTNVVWQLLGTDLGLCRRKVLDSSQVAL